MGKEPLDQGIAVQLDVYLLRDFDQVGIQFVLKELPEPGQPVILGIPAEQAVELGLALLAAVSELQSKDPLVEKLFPKIDPKKGN